MKNILDLRFIIGLFFGLTGLILIIGSFLITAGAGKTEMTNRWSGIVYLLFGLFMLFLWVVGKKRKPMESDTEVEES